MIKVTRDADGIFYYRHRIQTKGKFQRTYGYFETRAKFTRQPGWWGQQVWLYGVEVGPNPSSWARKSISSRTSTKPKRSSILLTTYISTHTALRT